VLFSLRNRTFQGVMLGKLARSMTLRSARGNGLDIMEVGLKTVKKICKEILKCDSRLETTTFFSSVDAALNPNKFDFSTYSADDFLDHLLTISSTLDLDYSRDNLSKDHKTFFNCLSLRANQEKYKSFWFKNFEKNKWDPLGVIESFQSEKFGLSKNFSDFTYLLAEVGLHKLSQSDTERDVKIVRRVEPRFSNFNETKLKNGKRDRCMQEIFLCDNPIALNKLPLDEYEKEWRSTHFHCGKIDARALEEDVSINNFLKAESSSLLFMEKRV